MKIKIPYHKSYMEAEIPDKNIAGVLSAELDENTLTSESGIVEEAMDNPISSLRLEDIAKGKKNILLITSDHTRPLPSRITIPILLKRIRKGNPKAEIRIVVATGFHRETTREELIGKFGKNVTDNENIIVHDAFDNDNMTYKGTLPSGGELWVNKLVDWADAIIAEGFIEPHMFAGFSGGRKSILPGICSERTIMYNHNAEFIADSKARTGILEGNPLHKDMVFAAAEVGLDFILNVTLDPLKRITAAYSGNFIDAHEAGCRKVMEETRVGVVKGDIVITSNGGYPLDQNIYQTVKGMTAAESCLNDGGIIIVVSGCSDGHGGESFYKWFLDAQNPFEVSKKILAIPREESLADQWEAQILARILEKSSETMLVSRHTDHRMVSNMFMKPFDSLQKAFDTAIAAKGDDAKVVIIPDGVGVIPEEEK